jgi:membrane protease YdiL (CAAX protease family)
MTNQPSTNDHTQSPHGHQLDWLALAFAILFPSIVTYIYFNLLDGSKSGGQQIAYAIGKALQFGFPVVWIWLFYRHRLRWNQLADDNQPPPQQTKSIGLGVGFGILVVTTMIALFYFVIQPTETGSRLAKMVCEKIASMGLDSTWKYIALGCFYTVAHSFLEEYYWRWFVYDLGKKFFSIAASTIVSSLGFAAHHVILLGFFFGWDSPWTYVISAAIAVGGVAWAWLFERDQSLWSAWISHAIVDAGIFTLGYFICSGAFTN